jgi:putative DNA-invertase from lambdoid prophage Rac
MTQRCGLWVRVSKDEQDTGNQLDQLRQWASRRGMIVTAEYDISGASAWTGAHHHELRRALDDARAGRFDVLLVWALDRLSREGVEATLALVRRFREHGVLVWSLHETWTETSDQRMAELLGSLFAWMAAEESRRRSERVRAGLERRRAAGLPVGRQQGAADL